MNSQIGFAVLVVAVGAILVYTMVRISRAPLDDTQRMLWQLLDFLAPGIGLILWYAFEFGRLKHR